MGSDRSWPLAQANLARMRVPTDHPSMETFRAQSASAASSTVGPGERPLSETQGTP